MSDIPNAALRAHGPERDADRSEPGALSNTSGRSSGLQIHGSVWIRRRETVQYC